MEIPNKTLKTLRTFRANIIDSMIELPDSWIYNESSKCDPSDLVWDYLNNRLDELENEQNDRYDHSEHKRCAGLSFLGFLGISLAHIIDGLITFLTRIMAVLSFIGFIHVNCKVFPLQEHTVQTHEGLYFVKAKKREIIPLIADVMDFNCIYINQLVLLDILPNQDMVESQEQSEWRKVANIQSEDELDIQIHYSKQLTICNRCKTH